MTSIYKHTNSGRMGRGEYMLTDSERAENRKIAGYARHVRKQERIKEYMDSTHSFQLCRGDQKFGKPQNLTGREAVEKNKKYSEKFWIDLDSDMNARLWRLVRVWQK